MSSAKYIAIPLLVGAVLAFSGCSGGHQREAVVRPEVTGVKATPIRPEAVNDYYEVSGTVRAKTVSVVSSRVIGTVTSIRVKEGDRVARGQTLLTIDDKGMRARAAEAEEALNEARRALRSAGEKRSLAEKTYERYRKLHSEKALSTQELDAMETEKNVAGFEYERAAAMVSRQKAGLEEAKVFLGYTKVTSPVTGIVSEKRTDTGSMAAPGSPLMVVEDDSAYTMEVNVDERYLTGIIRGARARVHIDSLEKTFQGTVVQAVPRVDPSTRTFLVKVEIEDSALRTGLYGKVRFVTGQRKAMLVPGYAVVRRGQLTGVYTVGPDGLVTLRLVRTGRDHDGRVELLSGVKPGEKVIVSGVENAMDGGVLREAI